MGLPLATTAYSVTAAPASDEGATQVLSGVFSAVGTSRPISVYGQFNFTLFGSLTLAIHTTAGSANVMIDTPNATVKVGQNINSTALPPGSTVVSFQTTGVGTVSTVQIGTLTAAQLATIATVADAAAVFAGIGITPTATVNLERTFDGGSTWVTAGIAGSGQPASYAFGSALIDNPVSVVAGEPERQIGYRFNCTAFSTGPSVNYRLSSTGLAAQTWGVPGN